MHFARCQHSFVVFAGKVVVTRGVERFAGDQLQRFKNEWSVMPGLTEARKIQLVCGYGQQVLHHRWSRCSIL